MSETTIETTEVDNTTEDIQESLNSNESVNTDEGNPESEPDEETITYKRSDLEKLRQEAGKYRQRAQQADQLGQRLHAELVRATGRLADPTDLAFNAEHLDDADKLTAAIDDLLTRKPHLASRRPTGDIGQGATPTAGKVDLASILRQRAG